MRDFTPRHETLFIYKGLKIATKQTKKTKPGIEACVLEQAQVFTPYVVVGPFEEVTVAPPPTL